MDTAQDAAIAVRGLVKAYGSHDALRGVDLLVPYGRICALLGPNGAGKTTTVEILEGFRQRDGGEVTVLGTDPAHAGAEHRARVGIVLQSTGVEPYLSVAETLAMYAGFYPHPREVDEVLALVGLTESRDRRVRQLSGGQQRRLDVGVAIVGDPELLFLDEPTTGFDPSARREAWDVIHGLRALGRTILLTTHYMDEAQHLADRVAVIAGGEIVAEGTPETLGGRDTRAVEVRFSCAARTEPPANLAARRDGHDGWTLRPTDLTRDLHVLTGWAITAGVELENLRIERPTLEDVYLHLTGASDDGVAEE